MASGDITIAGRIIFTEGLMVNVIQCQNVSITQDNLLEANENFNIFVSDVTANMDGADVSITDNVLLPTANATLTVSSSDNGCKLLAEYPHAEKSSPLLIIKSPYHMRSQLSTILCYL